MPALSAGAKAPEISLPLLDSGAKFSLAEARKKGPVLAAFFKVSCPVCQFSFPYLQRVFTAYGNSKVTFIGISQDSVGDTERFARQHGVSFPIALDDTKKYAASNAYGLTNVPSLFWILPDGSIKLSSTGWAKPDFEKLNQEIAAAAGAVPKSIFNPGEKVPDYKPG
jgi:peroxiredoxin